MWMKAIACLLLADTSHGLVAGYSLQQALHHGATPPEQKFAARYQATDDKICKGSSGFSGYVDSDDEKHMFFWAVPSRNSPETDPVILWLSGGPGASGVTVGGFKELGPCWYLEQGPTAHNPHSWTNNATVIFVDQPLNAGFSYSSHKVSTLAESTTDLHNFLKTFFCQFPQYASQPFYIAGQSYGGSYVPALAARIVDEAASTGPLVTTAPIGHCSNININLKGIMIGNGLMNVTVQRRGYYELGCKSDLFGHGHLLGREACSEIDKFMPVCEALESACSLSNLNLEVCKFSNTYCHDHIAAQIEKSTRYPYDLRRQCSLGSNGERQCEEPSTLESWMNTSSIRGGFGVDDAATYIPLNYEMEAAFDANGEIGYPSDFLVTKLLGARIRVLIYVGNMDWFCNAPGTRLLVDSLEWAGQEVFRSMAFRPIFWPEATDALIMKGQKLKRPLALSTGATVNDVQLWGYHKRFDLLSFFEVDQAGHAAAGHRPEEVLNLINGFIAGKL
ncbi:Alpha/Beta hydrolase protein [Aspergillus venezuelensis]